MRMRSRLLSDERGFSLIESMAALILLAIVLIATVASLTLPVVSVSAHNEKLRCGSKEGPGAGWFRLRSHYGIGCNKARDVAQRWEDKCVYNQNCPGEPDKINGIEPGFRCTHRKAGYETVRVRCTANEGPAVLHFLWGS